MENHKIVDQEMGTTYRSNGATVLMINFLLSCSYTVKLCDVYLRVTMHQK